MYYKLIWQKNKVEIDSIQNPQDSWYLNWSLWNWSKSGSYCFWVTQNGPKYYVRHKMVLLSKYCLRLKMVLIPISTKDLKVTFITLARWILRVKNCLTVNFSFFHTVLPQNVEITKIYSHAFLAKISWK